LEIFFGRSQKAEMPSSIHRHFVFLSGIIITLLLVVSSLAEIEPVQRVAVGHSSRSAEFSLAAKSQESAVGVPPPLHDSTDMKQRAVQTAERGPGATAISSEDIGFYHALIASLSVIIVSELGDKTWFIAAIMAMRHSRLTVFLGAISALALMTVLSACLGWATQIIPRAVTYYVSTALFAIFGLKMLHEGWHMTPGDTQESYKSADEEVQRKEQEMLNSRSIDIEKGTSSSNSTAVGNSNNSTAAIFRFVSAIFLEAFTLTFLAEWGDRSQLTTIILASRESVAGVCLGGIAGHAICTGIAVIGGKIIAQRISVRTVTLIGGVVFILFALSALVINPVEAGLKATA